MLKTYTLATFVASICFTIPKGIHILRHYSNKLENFADFNKIFDYTRKFCSF